MNAPYSWCHNIKYLKDAFLQDTPQITLPYRKDSQTHSILEESRGLGPEHVYFRAKPNLRPLKRNCTMLVAFAEDPDSFKTHYLCVTADRGSQIAGPAGPARH